ncbi:STAS domain-containing protein [Alishewanella sp. d11]|uniref:STAS domain-containing protein n=1 Tax=Alishewanella sp. d11 TaxID=3414030 RepID=UPI003BF78187
MSEQASIRLPERFDFGYHKQFNTAYEPFLEDRTLRALDIDFSQVQYLDSSALGMLVLLAKKFSGKGVTLKIVNAKGTAREIIQMANLSKLFTIE